MTRSAKTASSEGQRQPAARRPAPRRSPSIWNDARYNSSAKRRRKLSRPTNSVEVPKASCMLQRLHQRLGRRPEEEDGDHRELRSEQQPWQGQRSEADTLFHCARMLDAFPRGACDTCRRRAGRRGRKRRRPDGRWRSRTPSGAPVYLLAFSNRSSCSLPRFTAVSSASFADFLPDQTCSISSSTIVRICTKLPRRTRATCRSSCGSSASPARRRPGSACRSPTSRSVRRRPASPAGSRSAGGSRPAFRPVR